MSKTHRYYTEEFLDDLYRTAQMDEDLLKKHSTMFVGTSTISSSSAPITSTKPQEDRAFEEAIYVSLQTHKAENAKRGVASKTPTSKEEHYSELNSKLAKANADPEAPVYSGIGVEVVYNERAKGFEVISAYKNCGNGLQVGDIITHITNPATGKSEWLGARGDDETSQLMRGEVGSTATLTILRNGQEKTLDITRKVIDVKKQAAFDFPGAVRLLVMEKEVAQMKEMLNAQSTLLTEQGQALQTVTAENKTLRERIDAIDQKFTTLEGRVTVNETGLSRLSEKVTHSGDEGQDVPANVVKALGELKTELGVQIGTETSAREGAITGLKVEIGKKASAEELEALRNTTQQLSEGQRELQEGRREDQQALSSVNERVVDLAKRQQEMYDDFVAMNQALQNNIVDVKELKLFAEQFAALKETVATMEKTQKTIPKEINDAVTAAEGRMKKAFNTEIKKLEKTVKKFGEDTLLNNEAVMGVIRDLKTLQQTADVLGQNDSKMQESLDQFRTNFSLQLQDNDQKFDIKLGAFARKILEQNQLHRTAILERVDGIEATVENKASEQDQSTSAINSRLDALNIPELEAILQTVTARLQDVPVLEVKKGLIWDGVRETTFGKQLEQQRMKNSSHTTPGSGNTDQPRR